ncbi:MAG: response regulator [Treponema sp.]|nr:response regulator [Treponema sp.]
MLSVFTVDDEPIVLEGIRSKIDWEANGFTFAGEATDGEIALSMLQEIKPDILITDIKMPFMDGLELSTAIKKIQPWIKIIILSGHDEFEYAKKAISIGIEDYLLKPFTSEELLQSLNKTASRIESERKQLSDINKLKDELKSSQSLKKKEFLNNLVHSALNMNEAIQQGEALGFKLFSRFYKVLVSKIESLSENSQNQQEACSLVNSYCASWENAMTFFHHSNLFVCIFKGSSQQELDESVFHAAETIGHIVTTNEDCRVLTAIGKSVEHLSQLNISYNDAKNILQERAENINKEEKQNRIISFDDLQQNNMDLLDLKDADPLVDRIKYAGKNDITLIINESMDLIKNNSGQFTVFASYILVDLIFAVSKLVENLGGDIKEIKPEILQRKYVDDAVLNEEVFKDSLYKVLSFALEYRDSKIKGKYADVILKAKKYIEDNYADQNTTLSTVAEEVCLSPNHFSTIFSQECKTTFIEYLTNVRIEKAKKLMQNTDLKGYDIAYECGFSDPHYFSYIFKKNTGLSPREYKLQL